MLNSGLQGIWIIQCVYDEDVCSEIRFTFFSVFLTIEFKYFSAIKWKYYHEFCRSLSSSISIHEPITVLCFISLWVVLSADETPMMPSCDGKKGKAAEWKGRQRTCSFYEAFMLLMFFHSLSASDTETWGELGVGDVGVNVWHHVPTLTFYTHTQWLYIRIRILISIVRPSISLTTILSPHLSPGGRCRGKAMVRGREDVRRKKSHLKAFRSSGALLYCTSVMQDATTPSVGEGPWAGRRTVEQEAEQQQRGARWTDWEKERCCRIPTVREHGTAWQVCARERGRREERREEGRIGRRGRGRQFGAVQADWMSSSRDTGTSISTSTPSCSILLCGCRRMSCGCCSINITHIHTPVSRHRGAHLSPYTHTWCGGHQRGVSKWRGLGDTGGASRGRLEVETAGGGLARRRPEQQQQQ